MESAAELAKIPIMTAGNPFPGARAQVFEVADGSIEIRASFESFGMMKMSPELVAQQKPGTLPAVLAEMTTGAAEFALRYAGLVAAIRFGAPIDEFLMLGTGIKAKEEIGMVEKIDKTGPVPKVTIAWQSGVRTTIDVDALADELKGNWSLA